MSKFASKLENITSLTSGENFYPRTYFKFNTWPPLARVNILANSDPLRGGRNKKIFENEEEIRVFYCLALKEIRREEIINFGKNIYPGLLCPHRVNRHGRGGFKWDEAAQGILLSSYSNGNVLTLLLGGVVFTKGSPKNIAGKMIFFTWILVFRLLISLEIARSGFIFMDFDISTELHKNDKITSHN